MKSAMHIRTPGRVGDSLTVPKADGTSNKSSLLIFHIMQSGNQVVTRLK